jgi:hypothetical protein
MMTDLALDTLVSPEGDIDDRDKKLNPGLESLAGARIMLLDNTKSNSDVLFDHLEKYLLEAGASTVTRRVKSTAGKPAADHILAEIRSMDAVVAGVGDCGSCSSWTIHDFLTAEGLGIPSVGVVSEWFKNLAALEVSAAGVADPASRIVVVPHPFGNLTDEEVAAFADKFAADVTTGLTSQPR